MSDFSKTCPVCKKVFSSLEEFMTHIKTEHKDLSPSDILSMGDERKWKFRE